MPIYRVVRLIALYLLLLQIKLCGVPMDFGSYVRQLREQRREINRRYSIRQTAQRIGIEPAHLSKIERGDVPSPSEETIRRLAADLGEDVDVLLALAGKVSSDICEAITQRPILFAELIRGLSDVPDADLMALVCKVRNGEW
ncbi:Helix-turn-helix domain protein [Candidatus Contendobacter odensis Run_B_J11]|uniref:Helix-turn-helix domain protein n=2 Tax=Candidatus Contendibacter odensensis TaxID=1400860 RepID=A0A7U7J3T4_9GAMM|nr:Helix-turn-helix domain protein [Candidatus Contendobacter odensis Run_B_J11]